MSSSRFLKTCGILFMTAILFGVTACSNSNDSNSSSKSSTSAESPAVSPSGSNAPKPSAGSVDQPVLPQKITVDYMVRVNPTSPVIDDALNQAIQKKMNMFFNYIKFEYASYDQQFKLKIASGDIPDMIQSQNLDDSKIYGPQGAFLPLNDLLDKYGPNIVKVLKEQNVYNNLKASDGKIYALPRLSEVQKPQVLMIRKDWLDKYNLKVPNTLDDFINVLTVFRDKDPAGGGKTVPFGAFNYSTIKGFYDTFETDTGFVVLNDKIDYGPATDNMKAALQFINKMYKNKLINQNFLVESKQQFQADATAGILGSADWTPGRVDFFNQVLQDKDPNAKMIGILPLIGPNGKRRAVTDDLISNVVMLSRKTKYSVEIIKALNWLYTPEGQTMVSYGLPGITYEMKNAKPEFLPKMFETQPDNLPPDQRYALNGGHLPILPVTDASLILLEHSPGHEGEAKALEEYKPYVVSGFPVLSFTKEETDLIKKKLTAIQDTADQYIAKFSTGEVAFDQWDKYIALLKKSGLDDLVGIYNDAYVRYKSDK